MKYILMTCSIIVLLIFQLSAQTTITGRVLRASDNQPLPEATLRLLNGGFTILSDHNGAFALQMGGGTDTLVISYVGYLTERVAVGGNTQSLTILMELTPNELDEVEVINTGYYQVPKERATGSFVHIGNKLINRAVGANILQRLEGVAPGVQFVNPGGTTASDIRVRGLSTIESDETPLIVLDNFPYEGSLDNIDPNSIENITVLKDAAAASIWGARAGNGVIVITTKQAGEDGRVRISLNANANITDKPNLFYSRAWLPSTTVMEIEKERYGLGHYTIDNRTPIPLYVEWLAAYDEGRINAEELMAQETILQQADTRQHAMDYLYRHSSFQQYALNVSGGTNRYGYDVSAGYHNALGELIGDDSKRITLSTRNRFSLFPGAELMTTLAYVGRLSHNNGIDIGNLSTSSIGPSPYLQLVDEHGNALAVPRDFRYHYAESAVSNGLLDWMYRPLNEQRRGANTAFSNELRINGDLNTRIWGGISAKVSYQYVRGNAGSQNHHRKDSYYVRNLVNQFTQPDGSFVIPHGGILQLGNPIERFSHFGRAQLNFDRSFGVRHRLAVLGGAEIRHSQSETFPSSLLYNYSDDYLTGSSQFNFNQRYLTLPEGSPTRRIPARSDVHRLFINRDLSYFGNASYTYDDRYTVSGSIRWDASNLFGVKTNQKGVPLWSLGGSWELSEEDFYPFASWLPYARLRATYGISGNVNKTVTHYPTVRFATSPIGLNTGVLVSVGNPSLKWEKVTVLNAGLDWSVFRRRVSGSVEIYVKEGADLIGDDYMDPTTGISDNYKINYANIETRGVDLQLNIQNIKGVFNWNTTAMVNQVANKVTDFHREEGLSISYYLSTSSKPHIVGDSRDLIYAIPWQGLSPQNGYPLIMIDGERSTDYVDYYNSYLDESKLVKAGVSIPTFYGSIRNSVSWKGLEAGFMFTWKSGYVFRRSSIVPGGEFSQQYHTDYFRRWKSPGDEAYTNVPAYLSPHQMNTQTNYMGQLYSNSQALITKGDHVRLQEVNISYTLPSSVAKKVAVRGIKLYGYCRNLGILWRSNNFGIDPDFGDAQFVTPPSYSFGIQITL